MSENPRLHWTSPLRYSQPYPSDAPDTLLTREVRWGAGDLTPGTCRAETQYSRTARLTQRGDYLKGAAPAVSNPLMVRKTYFSMGPPVGTESEGDTRLLSAKEGTPPPLADDYYVPSMCSLPGDTQGELSGAADAPVVLTHFVFTYRDLVQRSSESRISHRVTGIPCCPASWLPATSLHYGRRRS